MTRLSLLLVALCCFSGILGKKGYGPGEQDWGFVKVRPDANMFWWLYFTTANVTSPYEKPLIIWLQGGPGASSTSYGNFEEIGPIDTNLKPRDTTWVKDYNVMFIDNPVGTGYSFASSPAGYALDNARIASDLVECIRSFLKTNPSFADVRTYITTESYGGKMGAEFALAWYKEQEAGTIKSNLKGVALGDAWISPIDSVLSWAPYLLSTGMIDNEGYEKIDKAARKTEMAVKAGQWERATSSWGFTQNVVAEVTGNIDFYNILTDVSPRFGFFLPRYQQKPGIRDAVDDTLAKLMNGPVKQALSINISHGTHSEVVFDKLQGDFMKPVIDKVEALLEKTDLQVVVISGNLDLIVDTPGTYHWVDQMNWKDSESWHKSSRRPVVENNIIEGYVKEYSNLAMYWVHRSGHMVPKDNPAAMAHILRTFTN